VTSCNSEATSNHGVESAFTDFQILPAGLGDLTGLVALERTCFSKDAWPLLDLMAALTLPGMIRLKAVIAGRMVGFVGGDPHPDEGFGWITTIGVDPEHRGVGIGAALLAACEAAMQVPQVRLCVRRDNQVAISLYEQKGYQCTGVWQHYYNDGEDALVYEKKIG